MAVKINKSKPKKPPTCRQAIVSLPPDVLNNVYKRLKGNQSRADIARALNSDYLPKYNVATIRKVLGALRKDLISGAIKDTAVTTANDLDFVANVGIDRDSVTLPEQLEVRDLIRLTRYRITQQALRIDSAKGQKNRVQEERLLNEMTRIHSQLVAQSIDLKYKSGEGLAKTPKELREAQQAAAAKKGVSAVTNQELPPAIFEAHPEDSETLLTLYEDLIDDGSTETSARMQVYNKSKILKRVREIREGKNNEQ